MIKIFHLVACFLDNNIVNVGEVVECISKRQEKSSWFIFYKSYKFDKYQGKLRVTQYLQGRNKANITAHIEHFHPRDQRLIGNKRRILLNTRV